MNKNLNLINNQSFHRITIQGPPCMYLYMPSETPHKISIAEVEGMSFNAFFSLKSVNHFSPPRMQYVEVMIIPHFEGVTHTGYVHYAGWYDLSTRRASLYMLP